MTKDLFTLPVEVIAITVNCVGVMGRGVALQAKHTFPGLERNYKELLESKILGLNKSTIIPAKLRKKDIFLALIATKNHWRNPSQEEWVVKGFISCLEEMKFLGLKSLGCPPLGCGNGGLDWKVIKPLLEKEAERFPKIEVIYTV